MTSSQSAEQFAQASDPGDPITRVQAAHAEATGWVKAQELVDALSPPQASEFIRPQPKDIGLTRSEDRKQRRPSDGLEIAAALLTLFGFTTPVLALLAAPFASTSHAVSLLMFLVIGGLFAAILGELIGDITRQPRRQMRPLPEPTSSSAQALIEAFAAIDYLGDHERCVTLDQIEADLWRQMELDRLSKSIISQNGATKDALNALQAEVTARTEIYVETDSTSRLTRRGPTATTETCPESWKRPTPSTSTTSRRRQSLDCR